MKNILTPLAFLLFFTSTLSSQAQVITVNRDTFGIEGKAFLIIRPDENFPANYEVFNLQNVLLMTFKYNPETKNNIYYYISEKGNYQGHFKAKLNTPNAITKAFHQNNVVLGDTLNPEGMERFSIKYPLLVREANEEMTGPRNREAPIVVKQNIVKQGYVQIGKLERSQDIIQGKTYKIFRVYDMNNLMVAEIRISTYNQQDCQIRTESDAANHQIKLSRNGDMEEEMIRFLVDRNYL